MRPFSLRGHTRPITKVSYNHDGDLAFSSSKDGHISVWYSINGERLGTYQTGERTAAVWSFDVDWKTKCLVSATAAPSLNLYDVESGRLLNTHELDSSARSCAFSHCGQKVLFSTDAIMGYRCRLAILDIRVARQQPIWETAFEPATDAKVDCSLWGCLDETFYTAHHNGVVKQWDARKNEVVREETLHSMNITDLQTDAELVFLISASKDRTAKLINIATLEEVNVYKTDKPVNSATISPIKDHVLVGGGQEARDVTTTTLKEGKFDARLFHLVYGNEFGLIRGHFGPINSLRFHPDGSGFVSGGEDGMVRLHKFDPEYLERD